MSTNIEKEPGPSSDSPIQQEPEKKKREYKDFGHEEEKVAPGWGVEEADQRHREDASMF